MTHMSVVSTNGTVFIPSFVKITQLFQKLKWGDIGTLKHVNTMAI